MNKDVASAGIRTSDGARVEVNMSKKNPRVWVFSKEEEEDFLESDEESRTFE